MRARRRALLAIGAAVMLHVALAWLLAARRLPTELALERITLELVVPEPPPRVAPTAPAPSRPVPPRAPPLPSSRERSAPPMPPEARAPVQRIEPEPPPSTPDVDPPGPTEAPPRVARSPSFLERVLRGTERGPSASFEPLDGGPDDLDDFLSLEEETRRNVEDVVALPPDPYLEPPGPVEIVVVDEDRRRSVGEAIDELQLDGRRRALATRSSRRLLLERRGDGSLVYDAPGFEAVIAPDGRVAFFDKPPIEAAPGPFAGDGRGSPQNRGSGTLADELMGSKIEAPLLPFLSGVHDLERALLSVAGADVHSREKAWFLSQTFEMRVAMRERASPSKGDAG